MDKMVNWSAKNTNDQYVLNSDLLTLRYFFHVSYAVRTLFWQHSSICIPRISARNLEIQNTAWKIRQPMRHCLVVVPLIHKHVPIEKEASRSVSSMNICYARGNPILPEVFHVLIRKILVRRLLLVHKLSALSLKSRRRRLDAVILPKSNKNIDEFDSLIIWWKGH